MVDETGFVYLFVSNCCSLLIGLMLAIFSFFLGKKQNEKELSLLRDQLEEQKKQREFEERIYQEQNQPKMPLSKWNIEG